MPRLSKWAVTGVILTVVVGAAGWLTWRAMGSAQGSVTFRTVSVEKTDLLATIRSTGTIEPEEVIDVGAQVAGRVIKFGVDPSNSSKTIDWTSPVHPGTLLAQLDDELYKARVEQMQAAMEETDAQVIQAEANVRKAEADLEQMKAKFQQAKRDFDRAQVMHPLKAIADADYDAAIMTYDTTRANINVGQATIAQMKASLIQAQKARNHGAANLREAEVNLGYTKIISPVEGVIVDRRVNVGQTVVAGLNAPSLFLIAKDLRRIQIWVSVNEADIGNITTGQHVTFKVDAYPKETFAGKVGQLRLNATMTQNVVTYTVIVDTDNSKLKLLPYMTANVDFEIAHKKDVLQVPNAALRWAPKPSLIVAEARAAFAKTRKAGHPEEGVVWLQDGALVRPITVRIGLTDGAQTEITSDELEPGMPVVIGTTKARNDDAGGSPFAPKMFGPGKK